METRVQVLSEDEKAQVHERTLKVLGTVGMRCDTAEGRRILAAAGADVDEATRRVRFPADLVESLLAQAPRAFTLHGRRPGWSFADRRRRLHPAGRRRRHEHLRRRRRSAPPEHARRLAGGHPAARRARRRGPVLVPHRVHPRLRASRRASCATSPRSSPPSASTCRTRSARRSWRRGSRRSWTSCSAARSACASCCRCRSSSRRRRRSPSSTTTRRRGWSCATTACPSPSCRCRCRARRRPAAASARCWPPTARPSARCASCRRRRRARRSCTRRWSRPWTRARGCTPPASVEHAVLCVAGTEMARYYGLPAESSGLCTQTYEPDLQTAWEKSDGGLLVALAGPDVLVGPGLLGGATVLCLEQIVLDVEVIRRARRAAAGVPVRDDLWLDEVLDVGRPVRLVHRRALHAHGRARRRVAAQRLRRAGQLGRVAGGGVAEHGRRRHRARPEHPRGAGLAAVQRGPGGGPRGAAAPRRRRHLSPSRASRSPSPGEAARPAHPA